MNYKEKLKSLIGKKTWVPLNPCHDDIYIVEFPKSGITWLCFLLANTELQFLEEIKKVTFFNVHHFIPDIHQAFRTNINRSLKNTFIKSHFAYRREYSHVIYLVRDPVDVMVSYYNYRRNRQFNGTFDEFVKSEEYGINKWRQHLDSWLKQNRPERRIIVLRYEDLLSDTISSLKSIYESIGLEVEDSIIENSIASSSVDIMEEYEESYRRKSPSYDFSFVGKGKKVKRIDIVSKETERYIYDCACEYSEYFK